MDNYDVITDRRLEGLIHKVNKRLVNGHWECQGGIYRDTHDGEVVFMQAIVRA